MLSSVAELEASFISFVGGANFHEHVQDFGEYKVDRSKFLSTGSIKHKQCRPRAWSLYATLGFYG